MAQKFKVNQIILSGASITAQGNSLYVNGIVVGGATGQGSTTIKQTEIDFGLTGVSEAIFTVIDAGVSPTSNLIAQLAYVAPTNKDLDEIEMDNLSIKCQPSGGGFLMYINSPDGSYLADKFKISYLIG